MLRRQIPTEDHIRLYAEMGCVIPGNIFLGGLYSDYPSYESIPDEAVEAALTEWESQLKDVFNNYVSISVKYMY